MSEVRWERYPLVERSPHAKSWLTVVGVGLAPATVDAYGRALQDYLAFSARVAADPETVGRAHIAAYLRDLTARPNPRRAANRPLEAGTGLANGTLQLYLTAVRLFYDHLVEECARPDNPVGRGRYTPGRGFGGARDRGLLPRYQKLPWIPTDDEWRAVLQAARPEPLRNRTMLALSYDAGLRREELCALATGDIDPARRLLRVRAEVTKGRRERVVPYSAATQVLYAAYLAERAELCRERGPLFRSESRRNRGEAITIWTWSKAVARLAERSGVPRFTPHTLRHLCLTDLARAGWDLHEIAAFAGHRSTQTTLLYIHLSGRDLAEKIARGMAAIHEWRAAMTAEVLG